MTPLRRHQWVNGALVAIAVVLVGVVIGTAGRATTGEKTARAYNVLAAYREDDVTRIVIERAGSKIVLERGAEDDDGEPTWLMTSPHDEEVDPFAMEKVLGTLQYASWVRRIKEEEVNRKAFGFDEPRIVIHVDMGDIKYRLRLGAEAATPKGAAYLEVAGENAPRKGAVIVSKSLIEELDIDVDELRERYVMPYLSPVLQKISMVGVGGTRNLVRAPWDGWRFDGMHDNARVGRIHLDRTLVQFARTVAESFIDPAAAKKAVAAGDSVIISMVPLPDKKLPPGKVIIGGKCPDDPSAIVALRTKPDEVAACVPANLLAGLGTPAHILVDRALFWMRTDEVESLEIVRGDRKLSMDRTGSGFKMRKPQEAEVDEEAGNERLNAILRTTGDLMESPDLKDLGLDPAPGRITVKSAAAHEQKVREEIVFLSAPDEDGTVHALRKHDNLVVRVGRSAARVLEPDASLIRDRKIFDYRFNDVSSVAVTGAISQTLQRSDQGDLVLETPEGFHADGLTTVELFDTVRSLTADRWVADVDDGSFGLDAPALEVAMEVTVDDTEKREVIVFGKRVRGGYYASVKGDPGVFIVPRRVYEIVTTLAIDRSAFMVDLDSTGRITLRTPDQEIVLEKVGGDFTQSGGQDRLPQAAIQRIVDALSVLRAEGVLDVGPPRAEHGLDRPLLELSTEPEAGRPDKKPLRWAIGSGDSWRGVTIHHARIDGVKATYALPRAAVQMLLESL